MKFLNGLSYRAPISAHFLPYIIFIGFNIALAYSPLNGGGYSHIGALSDLGIKSIVRNVLYYTGIFGDFFAFPSFLKPSFSAFKYEYLIPNIAGFILFIALLPLIFRGIKKQNNIFFLIFVLGSIALLIIWPFIQGIRFVFCILPFLVLYAFMAESKRVFRHILIAILAFFLIKDS